MVKPFGRFFQLLSILHQVLQLKLNFLISKHLLRVFCLMGSGVLEITWKVGELDTIKVLLVMPRFANDTLL